MTRTNKTWRIPVYLTAIMMLVSTGAAYGTGTHPSPVDEVDLPAVLEDEHAENAKTLLEKAGPDLTERLFDGQTGGFELIATGTPHDVAVHVNDRDLAMAILDEEAKPLFTEVQDTIEPLGGEIVAEWSAAPAMLVKGDLDVLVNLALMDDVHHVEHEDDEAFTIDPIPGDEMAADNTESRQMIQAEDIWASGFQGANITIAVIDTGVDASHEAFKLADGESRIAGWADCQSNGCDTTGEPFDDHGHGTHVSATAAGSDLYDDEDHGTFEEVGIAPKADLFGVKFLGATGGGSFQAAMDSLQWSFDNDADITSNSWGGGCSGSSSVIQLVNQLTDLGMVSVFAAGNSGSGSGTISGPACADTAISVGAVDADEDIAWFSSRGPCEDPTTDTGERTCPDVVAKGVDVRSAIPRSDATNADPSGYKTWQGTSMATPAVAGAVALAEEMKQHYDENDEGWDTPNDAEKEVLRLTAKGLPTEGDKPNNDYGWGLVQLLPIQAMLESSDEAVIVDSFSISHEEAFLNDEVAMSFSVTNLGSAVADGDFFAALEHPDGTQDVLKDTTVSLGLLDGESASDTLEVAGNVEPGVYTFSASFDYAWENGEGDTITDTIEHEASFEVKRVFFEMGWDGLEDESALLAPQALNFTATNTGNADAEDLSVEVSFPDSYEFVPGDNYNPLEPRTQYADPAPDMVVENPTFDRITFVWNVDNIGQNEDFSFSTQPLPTEAGDYSFMSVLKYEDAAGNKASQLQFDHQSVFLPSLE